MGHELAHYKELFDDDDYFRLYKKYFKDVEQSGRPYLNPSGYLDTSSPALNAMPEPYLTKESYIPYFNDAGENMAGYKEPLISLFSAWDGQSYLSENLTPCHSVTVASIITMAVLRDLGVKTLIFETPAYYATIYQAEALGIHYLRVPTYLEDNFRLNLDLDSLRFPDPVAVWLTQPRIALGQNQELEFVSDLLETLSPSDWLVIDEATEQLYPSHFAPLLTSVNRSNVIRMRSLFKGMGLNGLRLSMIIHPERLKSSIDLAVWLYQGGLDAFSLSVAKEAGQDLARFQAMLHAANQETTSLRRSLEGFCRGFKLRPSRLVNGYIGSAAVALPHPGREHKIRRRALLERLRHHRIVATLGASMMFPRHADWEFVRLNYFLSPWTLRQTVLCLRELAENEQ